MTESTATQSRRSDVINLQSLHPSLSHDSVCSAISEKFYDLHAVTENRKVRARRMCGLDVIRMCMIPYKDVYG